MSSDFLCPRCKKIHSYRTSFCPTDARSPTEDEFYDNLRYQAWSENIELDRLTTRIREIKGEQQGEQINV